MSAWLVNLLIVCYHKPVPAMLYYKSATWTKQFTNVSFLSNHSACHKNITQMHFLSAVTVFAGRQKSSSQYKKPSCQWRTSRSTQRGHASWNLVSCCTIRLGRTKTDRVSTRRLTLRSIHFAANKVNWTEIALNMLRAMNWQLRSFTSPQWKRTVIIINIIVVNDFDRTLLTTQQT